MSRKDYQAVAAALHTEMPTEAMSEYHTSDSFHSMLLLWDGVVTAMGKVFAADNPRFDMARFRQACKGE
jgi:hypothetical protein